MGYNTRVTGYLGISPPLTWAEIKERQYHLEGRYEVTIVPEYDSRDTDTGQETVITASCLFPVSDGPRKYYHLVEHVQEFVDFYARNGRTFTGHFECVGEEQPDMWRLSIVKGKATITRAAVLWPEDVAELDAALDSGQPHTVQEAAAVLSDQLRNTFAKQDRH